MNKSNSIENVGMITKQLFRLQLSGQIILHLVEKGFLADDEQAEEAAYYLTRLFASGFDLFDFSYEFMVTSDGDDRKFIA